MNSHNEEVTGFILAGGKSSRIGKDKGLIYFRHKPMITYAIELLQKVVKTIIINSDNPEYKTFGYPVVGDIIKNAGPLGGIYSCLSVTKTKYNLFLPCDMPLLDTTIIKLLLKNKDKGLIIVPQHSDGKIEPVCAIYHSDVCKTIEEHLLKGVRKIDIVIMSVKHYFLPLYEYLPQDYINKYKNINTLADLNLLQ